VRSLFREDRLLLLWVAKKILAAWAIRESNQTKLAKTKQNNNNNYYYYYYYTKGEEVCKGQQKMEGYSRKTHICKHFWLTKTTGRWGWTATSSHWLYLNHSHLIIFYVQFHHSLSLVVCIPTPVISNSFYFIRFPPPPWHTIITWQAWALIILLVQMFEYFKEILLFLFSKE
jgi:hypothetical protein